MKCSICKKPIVLVPSAKERAAKYGGTPAYYEGLFKTHNECFLAQRKRDTSLLMARSRDDFRAKHQGSARMRVGLGVQGEPINHNTGTEGLPVNGGRWMLP